MDKKAFVLLLSAVLLVAAEDGSSQLIKQPSNKIPRVGDDSAQDGTWWNLIHQPGDEMLGSPFVDATCAKACYLGNEEGSDELGDCLGGCEQTKMTYKSCNLIFTDDDEKREECLGAIDSYENCKNKCDKFSKQGPGCSENGDVRTDSFRTTYWGIIFHELDICLAEFEEGDPEATTECTERGVKRWDDAEQIHECDAARAFCDDWCNTVLDTHMKKIIKSG